MPEFNKPAELLEWHSERMESCASTNCTLASRMAIDMAMFEGIQWIHTRGASGQERVGRFFTDWHPDSGRLRVTANMITQLINRVAALTFPREVELRIEPEADPFNPSARSSAQALERMTDVGINRAGFLRQRRDANLRRSICGVYGVGFTRRIGARTLKIRGQSVDRPDHRPSFFKFDPTKLYLDPAVDQQDLWAHEDVVFGEPWSLAKVERELGLKLDADQCKTIGELMPLHVELAKVTQGRLFAEHALHSRTKGAMVSQIHMKSGGDRFDRMYIVVDAGYDFAEGRGGDDKSGRVCINFDNPESPFMDSGLPLTLYHGNGRSDSMWSFSDVALLRDAQNLRNLTMTMFLRHLVASAGFKVAVDERALPGKGDMSSFQQNVTNLVGGALLYKGRTREQAVDPPSVLKMPDPSPTYPNFIQQLEQEMQAQVHRPDETAGRTKTHVPNAAFQSALEQADQVGNVRVLEDVERDARLLRVFMATELASVHEQSAGTLGALVSGGFNEDDFASLLEVDPANHSMRVSVRESSVRRRPHQAREAALANAAQNQTISPAEWRKSLASDLDAPLTDDDGFWADKAQQTARDVMAGLEWPGAPVRPLYAEMLVSEFEKALLSREARRDPAIAQRLSQAIIAQRVITMQTELVGQPPPEVTEGGSGGAAAAEAAAPLPTTAGQALDGLGQPSTSASAAG